MKHKGLGIVFSELLPEVFLFAFGFMDMQGIDTGGKSGKGRRKGKQRKQRCSTPAFQSDAQSDALVPVSTVYAPMTLDPVQQFFIDTEWSAIQGKRAIFVCDAFRSAFVLFRSVFYAFIVNGNELVSRPGAV